MSVAAGKSALTGNGGAINIVSGYGKKGGEMRIGASQGHEDGGGVLIATGVSTSENGRSGLLKMESAAAAYPAPPRRPPASTSSGRTFDVF